MTMLFWFMVFLFLLLLITILVIWAIYAFSTPRGYDSLFRFMNVSVNHLGTTSINIVVHNRYKLSFSNVKVPLATTMRTAFATQIAGVAAGEPWEVVARVLGDYIYATYDVVGTSVEILLPAADSETSAATFSKGYISPVLKLDAVEA